MQCDISYVNCLILKVTRSRLLLAVKMISVVYNTVDCYILLASPLEFECSKNFSTGKVGVGELMHADISVSIL